MMQKILGYVLLLVVSISGHGFAQNTVSQQGMDVAGNELLRLLKGNAFDHSCPLNCIGKMGVQDFNKSVPLGQIQQKALAEIVKNYIFTPGRRSDVPAEGFIFYRSAVVQEYPEMAELEKMKLLLLKASDYCARLSQASLDFVCLEDISEKIQDTSLHGTEEHKHKYFYDYQFVKKHGQGVEKRRLLERDGINEKGNDEHLVTVSFFYRNVLFGAVDLLAQSFQHLYRYDLKGRELLDGEGVCVIDAVPVPGVPEDINQGRIWIRENDGRVLKILWNVRSMERHSEIQKTAKYYRGKPEIIAITEFGFEKNGIRFPSRFLIEEAYISKKGKKFIKSVTEVVYRDYKFFTVEVDQPLIK
jgi:hypothetical protein